MESAESISCLICVFSYLINYSDALTYYIPEEQPIDTLIGNIAFDEDIRSLVSEEDFNNLEYHFLNSDNLYLDYFAIDSTTSDLRIQKPLDWETVCEYSTTSSCPMSLDVAAQGKIGTFFKKISVTIILEDINDHPPVFKTSSISLTISESEIAGKPIGIDAATDSDSANFSVQSYEIIPSDVPFRADFQQTSEGSSLYIVIDGKLDRETIDNYFFVLIASDNGEPPLNGSMMVNVTVEDDNDNRPVFDQAIYKVTVKENYPLNITFLNVTANDLDLGRNAEISYHLSSQQSQFVKDTFNINSSTGELYLADQLEYVSDSAIKVKIEAVDNGVRPLTSQVIVEVTVEDTENNVPVIKLNLLSNTGMAETSEYASVGSVVSYIEVIDSDGDRNGLVTCEIENKFFGLQPMEAKEYKVIVFSTLDRETSDKHNVTITCQDYGVPRLTSSAQFTVMVLDMNDNAPKFKEVLYPASVLENNDIGSTIIQVLAKDADIDMNGQVSYYLNTEDRKSFAVNPKTGLITANTSFDREDRAVYEFIVYATDAGNPPLSSSTTVSVTINDQNDNAPVFDKPRYDYYIPESQSKETVLGRVMAEDSDSDGNGYVLYDLHGNYSHLPFKVLPDGTVKTTDSLDRELVPNYNFQVVAMDNGIETRLSSVVNVTVHVTDINDHYPEVIFPNDINFKKYITFMMPEDTQIMKIEAADADEGKHAELTYDITVRNDSKMFDLGRNGEINVARRMTENDVGAYNLGITISDQGSPPKQAFTKITIVVLMKNVTALNVVDDSIDKQNIIIAVVVVVVTVVIAIAILIIIWVVRRHDQQKKYGESRNVVITHGSNENGYQPGIGNISPNVNKIMGNGLTPSAPILTPISVDRQDGKLKDMNYQEPIHHIREQSTDSNNEQNTHHSQQLHRLASLRLQQALIQNHTKHWTSQSELTPEVKVKQEDFNSDDLSGDTATYDSGMGGSVSDTGDLRLTQLQQIVKQNGRRGQPPHKSTHGPSKPPRIVARGRSENSDQPPERPPPLKNNPYKTKSPVQSPIQYSSRNSPSQFAITSSPTPCSPNQLQFTSPPSPTKFNMDRQSPSKSVVQDLLMYKKFQNGLRPPIGRLTVDESVDTTHIDDDGSTTSGSYYIDNTVDDWKHPPVSDIYV
ncbi:hypothetical protein ACF0H5_010704 [Mactra antiquata]